MIRNSIVYQNLHKLQYLSLTKCGGIVDSLKHWASLHIINYSRVLKTWGCADFIAQRWFQRNKTLYFLFTISSISIRRLSTTSAPSAVCGSCHFEQMTRRYHGCWASETKKNSYYSYYRTRISIFAINWTSMNVFTKNHKDVEVQKLSSNTPGHILSHLCRSLLHIWGFTSGGKGGRRCFQVRCPARSLTWSFLWRGCHSCPSCQNGLSARESYLCRSGHAGPPNDFEVRACFPHAIFNDLWLVGSGCLSSQDLCPDKYVSVNNKYTYMTYIYVCVCGCACSVHLQ